MIEEYLQEVISYIDLDYPAPTVDQIEDFYDEGILPHITAVKWMDHVDNILDNLE